MDYKDVILQAGRIPGQIPAINISDAFKGQNFMTREVLNYYKRGIYQIELSLGSGFSSSWLFGVTVAINDVRDFDKSTCFDNLTETIEYMDNLVD